MILCLQTCLKDEAVLEDFQRTRKTQHDDDDDGGECRIGVSHVTTKLMNCKRRNYKFGRSDNQTSGSKLTKLFLRQICNTFVTLRCFYEVIIHRK